MYIYKKKNFLKINNIFIKKKGESNKGNIVIYHRGGGLKYRSRILDHKRFFWNIPGLILSNEYDFFYNKLISLVCYSNGVLSFIISPKKLMVGDIIKNGFFNLSKGFSSFLYNFPIGSYLHNIEINTFKGGQYCRSFGSYALLLQKDFFYSFLKLKSGKVVKVDSRNIGSYGIVNTFFFKNKKYSKAGFFRRYGWRPVVRGVAMNPIDHPHGGGEGKSSGGRPSVSRWNWLTKNVKKKI